MPSAQVVTDPEMLYIAIGILGATVMPHNLYLHSALVQSRAVEDSREGKREACRLNFVDTIVAREKEGKPHGVIVMAEGIGAAGTALSTSGKTLGHRVLGGGRAALLVEREAVDADGCNRCLDRCPLYWSSQRRPSLSRHLKRSGDAPCESRPDRSA